MSLFFRVSRILLFLAFFAPNLALAADSDTPPKPGKTEPPKNAAPQLGNVKDLEGLGFSEAPKTGGKARTAMFGLVGEGYKFVYVFDRSGSMGIDDGDPLKTLKTELAASLKNLNSVHQFQIVSYNEKPTLFNPTGTPGKLTFANDSNKAAAERYLDSLVAAGGTDHAAALRMATNLKPDVIFFMTDGDDPALTSAELDKIERWAEGIIIHAIQFGTGDPPEKNNFLKDLAHRTGGEYTFVNAAKWTAEKK
jgi:hypothetical protein